MQELIGDPNPMVVANSVTALVEITESAPETTAFIMTPPTLKKLYPKWDEFISVLREVDPKGVFRNEYVDRHIVGVDVQKKESVGWRVYKARP